MKSESLGKKDPGIGWDLLKTSQETNVHRGLEMPIPEKNYFIWRV